MISNTAETAKLVRLAKENPWHLFTQSELAYIMGISDKAVRAMKNAGAPFVVNKSHPEILFDWIKKHPETIGKLK